MKIIKVLVCALALMAMTAVQAQTAVDPVAQFHPEDGVFMDIAVDMAQASLDKGGQPGGTAIILNGAFHSAGNGSQPEIAALQKAHALSLNNAVVYTINEPVTAAWVALSQRGVTQIYFVNSRDEVVAAGIFTAADYDESALPQDGAMTPKSKVAYPTASALIKK